MSRYPRCHSCKFREPDKRYDDDGDGYCHRYPPQGQQWPIVKAVDWCGEHIEVRR